MTYSYLFILCYDRERRCAKKMVTIIKRNRNKRYQRIIQQKRSLQGGTSTSTNKPTSQRNADPEENRILRGVPSLNFMELKKKKKIRITWLFNSTVEEFFFNHVALLPEKPSKWIIKPVSSLICRHGFPILSLA